LFDQTSPNLASLSLKKTVLFACERQTTQELQQRLHAGRDAKRLMVEHNIRLAVHVARKYCNKGVPLGDLVQEGLTGLVKAIEKFNPDLGFRFSTYAHYWVRQVR
jgi:RNA polymerase nonessential primary-like sigma factor